MTFTEAAIAIAKDADEHFATDVSVRVLTIQKKESDLSTFIKSLKFEHLDLLISAAQRRLDSGRFS